MDRPAHEWTTTIVKAAILVVAIMGGTYLLLAAGRHLKPGCFGFTATCAGDPSTPAGAAEIESCVSRQYAAACPLLGRLAWLVVWLAYCVGVVGVVMKREIKERFFSRQAS